MKIWKNQAVRYAAVVLFVIVFYVLFGKNGSWLNRTGLCRGAFFVVILTGMVVFLKKYTGIGKSGAVTEEQLVVLLLCMGILMRTDYMLYTACDLRSHDLWEMDVNSYGHASYLLQVMEGHLPETNTVQLYQQPLFYILGAAVSKFLNLLLQTGDAFSLVDASKTVSCIASCISLIACREIFRECGLKGWGLIRAMMLVTFLPVYYLSGGRVGPDALAGMFMMLVFLFTLKWVKEKSWKNTIILAILYGLGMMTKISCATLAVFTFCIFVGCFYKGCKDGTWKALLAKFAVFAGISLPLGLWYSVRNYLRFGQSLTYVPVVGEDSSLYTGNYSVFQRIFAVNLKNLFENPFTDVFADYNLPVYALKSSLFGEFRYDGEEQMACVLLFFAALLAVCCIIAIVYGIGFAAGDRMGKICLIAAGIYYTGIVVFYLKYPYGCSMDFRYMLFLPVPLAVLLGKCKWFCGNMGRYADICCIGFSVASFLIFG